MIRISPSVLSADFTRLGEEIRASEQGGCDRFHIDVMDGHFVPNISMGPFVVEAVRSITKLPLETHLMIDRPERYVDTFIRAGADVVIVHQENTPHLHRIVQQVREQGIQIGVALNPGTPAHTLDEVIDELDLVLVMSVNPGFSGQKFIASTLPKMRLLRDTITRKGLACDLEVDGGVNADTAPQIAAAGVNVLVAATAIYKHPQGIAAGIRELRDRAAAQGVRV
ncbi:MAG: ribulose-phosphate 3-epimerase [candidate division Zixibacteria bacterium]|nr:ribulose-phosphate 3-epimerase [candidate division Zixibacteria bacterium]